MSPCISGPEQLYRRACKTTQEDMSVALREFPPIAMSLGRSTDRLRYRALEKSYRVGPEGSLRLTAILSARDLEGG